MHVIRYKNLQHAVFDSKLNSAATVRLVHHMKIYHIVLGLYMLEKFLVARIIVLNY